MDKSKNPVILNVGFDEMIIHRDLKHTVVVAATRNLLEKHENASIVGASTDLN
jgi:hypothetical protein